MYSKMLVSKCLDKIRGLVSSNKLTQEVRIEKGVSCEIVFMHHFPRSLEFGEGFKMAKSTSVQYTLTYIQNIIFVRKL